MSRAAFYKEFRAAYGQSFGKVLRLSKTQVEGIETLLDNAPEDFPLDWLAECLATPWLETGKKMQPIHELGGKAYFTKKYDINGSNPAKARELGNVYPGDGNLFHGRGYVQLTGRANYAKATAKLGFGLVANPDLALNPRIAAKILFQGMSEGWFTGRKLSNYYAEGLCEPKLARQIINGMDRADEHAKDFRVFQKAVRML